MTVEHSSMQRWSTDSTTLLSVAYSSHRTLLELQFRDGAVYWFFDVPVSCVQQLLASDSKGAYFNTNIRNSFRYQRVSSGAGSLPKKTK